MPDMIADIKDNASNISADYYLDGANVGHTAVEYSTSAYEDFAPTSDIKKGMTFAEQQETAGILLTLYFATFHHWAHNYLDTHFEMLKEKKFYHSITIDNIHGYDLPKSYMRGLAVTAGIVNEEDKHKQLLILKREESSALAVKNEVYKLSQEEAERQIKEQEEINEKEKEKKAEDPDDPESERYWTKKKWKETKSVFILQIHLSQTSCFMSLDESTQIDTFKNQELEEWRKKPVVLTIKSENVPFNMLEMVRNKIWQNTSTTKDSIFQITFCEKHKATAKFNGTQYNKFVHMFNKYIDKVRSYTVSILVKRVAVN
jgi:hypothetical protein